ncbi:MAG TPA: hypothetical protein VFN48_11110 [Solirubrobacteraceae bacterium]|nr:hypothetical protein [Solirubrobacteraceae bacterium]
MTALALDMQLDFWSSSEPVPGGPAEAALLRTPPVGGERTLEDILLGAWEGLAAHHAVRCPVCRGDMVPSASASASARARARARASVGRPAVAGRCEDCGTRLC